MTDNFKILDFDIFIANYRLRVRTLSHPEQNSQKPVLVFLHEGLGCIDMWRDFPEEIARKTGCDVMLYDRLGHGKSDSLPPLCVNHLYLYPESWEILPEVLRFCKIKQAVLIGHSDGGTIALLFASKFPQWSSGVITEAAHVFIDDLTINGIKQAVHAYNTSNLKEKLLKYHGNNLEGIFGRWKDIWLSSEFADWNIEKHLKQIKCPVLAMQGDADEYGTIGQLTSIAKNTGGYSQKYLIPNCRHIPHHQARKITAEKMSRFILEHCL